MFQGDTSVVVLIDLCYQVIESNFCAVLALCMFLYLSYVWVTEWPPIGE